MKQNTRGLIVAVAALCLSAAVGNSFAQTQPRPSPTASTTIQAKPKPTRACWSVQSCNQFASDCISWGPGWEFVPSTVDQIGRPASGTCQSPHTGNHY